MTTDTTEAKNGPEWAHGFFIALRLLVVFFAFNVFGQDPSKEGWVMFMIIVAGGVLFPLARPLQQLRPNQLIEAQQWMMTQGLLFALLPRPGNESAYIAACWIMWCGLMAGEALWKHLKSPLKDAGNLCVTAAGVFPMVGAAWLVAHRANWTPWGFDPLIVLLTAAHFHHAGFTLPLMAGLNAKARPGCWTRFSCVAILLGVPFVAAGITCTHFGVLPFVEPFGVTILVIGALGVAVSQIERGFERERSGLTRVAFVISGVSLLAAMLLAMSFGLRYVFPQLALTMPQMWMIHGTLNAFGFGLCGILAWRGAGSQNHPTKPC